MHAHEFVELLAGVQEVSAGKWNAHCPAHEDRYPSMVVTEGNGRVLVHCHAGCALGSILAELGLDWRDIFNGTEAPPDAPEGYVYVGYATPAPRPEGGPGVPRSVSTRPRAPALPSADELDHYQRSVTVVAPRLLARKGWTSRTLNRFRLGWDGRRITIPVYDGTGNLVSVLRYRPGAHDYKMLAPKGAGRHLFPAPEAVRVQDLWLVEGEPDAITAYELELPAVAVPGVATWREEWAERFLGRRVTICLDCDVQGRAAAEERRRDLEAYGVQARVVDLAPAKENGYDLGDALRDARELGALDRLYAYLRQLNQAAWA